MIEHGDFEIIRSNSVIITRAKGPWNEESTIRFTTEMRCIVEKMAGKPYASVGIFYGESILIPDAVKQISKLTKWRKEHGLQCVALVLNEDILTKSLTMELYTKIYSESGVEHQFFDRFAHAINWLTERKFYL